MVSVIKILVLTNPLIRKGYVSGYFRLPAPFASGILPLAKLCYAVVVSALIRQLAPSFHARTSILGRELKSTIPWNGLDFQNTVHYFIVSFSIWLIQSEHCMRRSSPETMYHAKDKLWFSKMFSTEIELCEDYDLSIRCMNRCYYDQQDCMEFCEDETCQYVEGFFMNLERRHKDSW